MTDTNEPSYYEVALTNRQVLVSFVVLLGCILTAFVFGVWVGKDGSDPAVDSIVASSDPADMAQLEELQGFGSDGGQDTANPPDLTELLNGSSDTTLAQDIGSAPPSDPPSQAAPPRQASPPPSSTAPPPPTSAAPEQAPPRQAPPRQAPPRQAPPPAAATPAQEGFIVQVFSSHDQVQANKILQQMKQGGYRAFLSPLRRDGSSQVMYRVRLGPYDEKGPADSAAKDIRSQYKLDTWVTAASN